MLVPVIVHANYKITSSLTLTLESVLGSNLPLMFPEVRLLNRTPTTCAATVTGVRRTLFTTQTDADFDGGTSAPVFSTFALGSNLERVLEGFPTSGLLPARYGVTHELIIANSGPAAELRVSLLMKGMIETAISPDPFIVINV